MTEAYVVFLDSRLIFRLDQPLARLMVKAVDEGKDMEFSELFGLLRRLQARSWAEVNEPNFFHTFSHKALFEAIARKKGIAPPDSKNFPTLTAFRLARENVVREFLQDRLKLPSQEAVLNPPASAVETWKINRDKRHSAQDFSSALASTGGGFCLCYGWLAGLTLLLAVPFHRFPRETCCFSWPRALEFSTLILVCLAAGVFWGSIAIRATYQKPGLGATLLTTEPYLEALWLSLLWLLLQAIGWWVSIKNTTQNSL